MFKSNKCSPINSTTSVFQFEIVYLIIILLGLGYFCVHTYIHLTAISV